MLVSVTLTLRPVTTVAAPLASQRPGECGLRISVSQPASRRRGQQLLNPAGWGLLDDVGIFNVRDEQHPCRLREFSLRSPGLRSASQPTVSASAM